MADVSLDNNDKKYSKFDAINWNYLPLLPMPLKLNSS